MLTDRVCISWFQSWRDADASEDLSLLSSSSCSLLSFTMPQRSSSSSISSTFDEALVHQLRSTNCSKFTALVNMHLSFLLDLSGACLSELIEDRASCTSSASEPTDLRDKTPAIVSVFSKKKHGKGSYCLLYLYVSCLRFFDCFVVVL